MTQTTIPRPEFLTFDEWLAALHGAQLDFDVLPKNAYTSWQKTACSILQSQICRTANCPSPYQFETWQQWAIALIKSFGGVR